MNITLLVSGTWRVRSPSLHQQGSPDLQYVNNVLGDDIMLLAYFREPVWRHSTLGILYKDSGGLRMSGMQ